MFDPVDIVIPLGTGSRHKNDELRLLLRSLEVNGRNYRNVIVVAAAPPEWIKNAIVINMDDPLQHNKDGNIIRKVLAAAVLPEISPEFLWTSDDCVMIDPFDCSSVPPIFNNRSRDEFPIDGTIWQRRVRRTFDYLLDRGIALKHNFESHVPQRFHARKLIRAMRDVDYKFGIGYSINTLFYGILGVSDGFEQKMFKSTHESAGIFNLNRMLCGYNDSSFDSGLREKLFEKFPNRSKYERA